MKRFIVIVLITSLVQALSAQPEARRREQQTARKQRNERLTTRAQISFPVAETMPEDVVWRRDIYREIRLDDEPNAGLYYPVEPVGGQMNLFCYLFKLVLSGNVPAYEYRLDGNEVFADSSRVKPLAFLDNYHIFYERVGKGIHLDNSDIPSREVKGYYIKESTFYDQTSATFHTQVLALCPIMEREDDFGSTPTKYPLFWIRYADLAPFLVNRTLMASSLNNAAVMTLDDFFTAHHYRGKIYKTNNLLGKTLAQSYPTDSAMAKAQKRIEDELQTFEQRMWGDPQRKAMADSIAKNNASAKGKSTVKRGRRVRSTTATVKASRRNSGSASGTTTTSPARVSVRRERH
nr:gliding motility protein GldN [Hoylesella enoeca]